jgi:hypothetical protein
VPEPLPEATWKPPARTPQEEAQYREDTRLDVPCRTPGAGKPLPVWQALGVIANAAGVDLIVATGLDERPLTVDWSRTSVREALAAVEERTGGRWRPVGSAYALQQDPRVERVTATPRDLRERRLRETLERFRGGLGKASRENLVQNGEISVAQLAQSERTALTDAAVVAFVVRENIARRALKLQDIGVRLLPADATKGSPRRLEVSLPALDGTRPVPFEVTWAEPAAQ